MATLNDNGVDIWYEVQGEGEPLVLNGGFGLLHDQWVNIKDILAKDFQVINWNYRGAGQSDRSWPGGFTLDRWVDDLALVLDHLGHDQVKMWGTSTGSFITTRFGARYPGRVTRLISYPLFKSNPAFRVVFKMFQDVAETFGYEALGILTQWIGCAEKNVLGGDGHAFARYEIEAFKRNFSIESLAKTMELFAHCDLPADVQKLTMPTMLLMGSSGNLSAASPGTADLVEAYKALCPHVEIALIEEAGGTYCMIEEPEKTAPVAVEFLKRE